MRHCHNLSQEETHYLLICLTERKMVAVVMAIQISVHVQRAAVRDPELEQNLSVSLNQTVVLLRVPIHSSIRARGAEHTREVEVDEGRKANQLLQHPLILADVGLSMLVLDAIPVKEEHSHVILVAHDVRVALHFLDDVVQPKAGSTVPLHIPTLGLLIPTHLVGAASCEVGARPMRELTLQWTAFVLASLSSAVQISS